MDNTNELIYEFTRPRGHLFPVLSWLIRLFQWKWWEGQKWAAVPSHCRIRYFDPAHDVYWVYEAAGSSVRLVGYPWALDHTRVVKTVKLNITQEDMNSFIQRVNQVAGTSYGRLQLIGYIFILPFKCFNIRLRNPFQSGKFTQVCAEVIFESLKSNAKFKEVVNRYIVDNRLHRDTVDINDCMKILEVLKDGD